MMSGSQTLAAGIQPPSSTQASVRSIVERLDTAGRQAAGVTPVQIVAEVAESLANTAGVSLVGTALRLFAQHAPRPLLGDIVSECLAGVSLVDADAPFMLGRLYELLLTPQQRRQAAAHLTSSSVAAGVVDCLPANSLAGRKPVRVLDPAVGGAAFLLAAAERQRQNGMQPNAIFDGLAGVDTDPGAVVVAEAALALWLVQHDCAPRSNPRLQQGDGLVDSLPMADVVVGNPPFRSQLQRDSARSSERRKQLQGVWGSLAGAYTDDAWLFLAAGLQALAPGGVMAMIQPLSILAARHASPTREAVSDHHELIGLWVPFEKVFDASVDVCAVVVKARVKQAAGAVKRWTGPNFEPCPTITHRSTGAVTWGPLAAEMQGVPMISLRVRADRRQRAGSAAREGIEHHRSTDAGSADAPAGTLRNLADSTAGFRRQFYGFEPHVAEAEGTHTRARLVTVGMIDPLVLLWGKKQFTFAGHRYQSPVVDLDSLVKEDPALGEWVAARRRPKILVATQTRLVEAWVDDRGDSIPATPVISVEPHDPADVWRVAAVLNAPVVNAWLAGISFGTALSVNAMKFSASDLGQVPLPADLTAWNQAAELLRERAASVNDRAGLFAADGLPAAFAEAMTSAYCDDSAASAWWLDRLEPLLARHR